MDGQFSAPTPLWIDERKDLENWIKDSLFYAVLALLSVDGWMMIHFTLEKCAKGSLATALKLGV